MPLATSHAHALLVLSEQGRNDAEVSQQELGLALGIDKSNVARLCAKLERAGHLMQSRSPRDGRVRIVALTSKGRRLAERVEASSRDRFGQLVAAMPPGKRANVLEALAVLNGAVRAVRSLEASA